MENKENAQPDTTKSNKEETPPNSSQEHKSLQTGQHDDKTTENVDAKSNAKSNANANAEIVEEPPEAQQNLIDATDQFIRKYFMKKTYRYTTEEEITISLRDALLYFMFLSMLTITCFSMHNYYFYHYQTALRNSFEKREFAVTNTSTISFTHVHTKHDFWNFMEFNFLSIMHALPRRKDPNRTVIPDSRAIFKVNHLLRPPRFLQVRVISKPCNPILYKKFTTCYPPYTTSDADRTPTYKGSKFYDQKELQSVDVWGLATNYETSGYIEDLNYNYEKSLKTIRRLRDLDWIDRGTRLVLVQFITFNQNANFFGLVRLKAEILPCGFVLPKIHIGNINMLSFFNQPTAILKIVFLTLYLFVIYYTTVEFYELTSVSWAEYFSSLRNIVDLSILAILYALLITNIRHVKVVASYKNHIIMGAERNRDMLSIESLSKMHTFYVNLTAIVIVLSYLNFLKFIAFHRAMVMLLHIFKRSAAQLVTFTLVFIMIFMMYAFLGVIVFCRSNGDFLYFSTSILTMARMITGDFDLRELLRANIIFAPFFLISYMCVIIFFMINIFIAIINFNYIEIKSAPPPPETKVFQYFKKHFLYLLYHMNLIKIKPPKEQHAKKIDIFREEERTGPITEDLPEDHIRHVDLPEDIEDELISMNASLDEVESTLERFVKNMHRIEHRL